MSSDLVPEFKLGIYAFESMFNKRETTTTYGAKNSYRIHPGLKETATAATDVDDTLKLEDGSKLADSSVYGETHERPRHHQDGLAIACPVDFQRLKEIGTWRHRKIYATMKVPIGELHFREEGGESAEY